MLIIANAIGYLYARRRIVLSVAAFLVILVLSIALFRACGHRAPKLNNDEILKSQQAIAANDRQTQIEILANSDVREQQIDSNIAAGRNATVNAIADSKAEWANKTNEEIAAELERRSKE
jgi:hypothetical protein